MAASIFFDEVPECMIETLLIVHGSGDRNSPEFTQVCETWTRILAPWLRPSRRRLWPCGKERARWNGKYYCWYEKSDQLYEMGVYANGKKKGKLPRWHRNGQLDWIGVYVNGRCEGKWQGWYDNGQIWWKTVYCNGNVNGVWQEWYDNGQLHRKGMFVNAKKEGEWHWWHWEDTSLHNVEVYHNGKLVTNE